MKRYFNILISIFLISTCLASNNEKCNCFQFQSEFGIRQDSVIFNFSNGKSIILCGFYNEKEAHFSEFTLSVCGHDNTIGFWGAVKDCKVKQEGDTLLIDELKDLPVGNSLDYAKVIWTTNKIYFEENNLINKLVVNRDIKKYNQNEIQLVLSDFLSNYEKKDIPIAKEIILNRIFIACISGSQDAEMYFNDIEKYFGVLDGIYKEEYNDLKDMLQLWNKE